MKKRKSSSAIKVFKNPTLTEMSKKADKLAGLEPELIITSPSFKHFSQMKVEKTHENFMIIDEEGQNKRKNSKKIFTSSIIPKKESINNANTKTQTMESGEIEHKQTYEKKDSDLEDIIECEVVEKLEKEKKEDAINFKALNVFGSGKGKCCKKPSEVAEKLASEVLAMIKYFSLDKHKKLISRQFLKELFSNYQENKVIDELAYELAVRSFFKI